MNSGLRVRSPAVLGALALLLLGGCAGDEAILKVPERPTGLRLADAGLDPSDPAPLVPATAWALVRDAEEVRVRVATVPGAALEAGEVDPTTLDFQLHALIPTSEPDPVGRVRWEVDLPPRGAERALLYWFEALGGEDSARWPMGAPGDVVTVAARPLEIDFPWPAPPPLSVDLPCRGDVTRVFDGAEDEATLSAGPPFEVIREPIWTPADRAQVIANRAGVTRGVGVEVEGQAYFFPLAVMLWNEVSNQTLGTRRTALTYCPLTDTALHFDTGFDPANLPKWRNFAPAGLFNSNVSVGIEGRRAGESTSYNQMLGFGITGPDVEACLEPLPSILVEFDVWKRMHPGTLVLEGDPEHVDDFQYVQRQNPYELYWRSPTELRAEIARRDERFGLKQRVMGLLLPDEPVAVPLGRDPFVHHTEAMGVPVAILHHAGTAIALEVLHPITGESMRLRRSPLDWRGMPLYEDDSADPSLWSFEGVAVQGSAKGERLAWVPSMSAFWFAWYAIYPETRVETVTP